MRNNHSETDQQDRDPAEDPRRNRAPVMRFHAFPPNLNTMHNVIDPFGHYMKKLYKTVRRLLRSLGKRNLRPGNFLGTTQFIGADGAASKAVCLRGV